MKNNYRIVENIVYIELKRNDGTIMETVIDLDDFDKINSYNSWLSQYSPKTKSYYAYSSIKINNKWTSVQMHRVVMDNLESKLQVDHINHNTLDNRKSELRLVTPSKNQWNQKNPLGYCWNNYHKKWHVRIRIDYKSIHIGYFDNEEEARNAYLKAKSIYHIID